jgi:4-aminobutyrate aminotransferase-like enzyme
VLLEAGAEKNIIRLAPPLIVKKEEMERGLEILEEAIERIT